MLHYFETACIIKKIFEVWLNEDSFFLYVLYNKYKEITNRGDSIKPSGI